MVTKPRSGSPDLVTTHKYSRWISHYSQGLQTKCNLHMISVPSLCHLNSQAIAIRSKSFLTLWYPWWSDLWCPLFWSPQNQCLVWEPTNKLGQQSTTSWSASQGHWNFTWCHILHQSHMRTFMTLDVNSQTLQWDLVITKHCTRDASGTQRMPTRIDFGITGILPHLLGNFDREITRLKPEHTDGRYTQRIFQRETNRVILMRQHCRKYLRILASLSLGACLPFLIVQVKRVSGGCVRVLNHWEMCSRHLLNHLSAHTFTVGGVRIL